MDLSKLLAGFGKKAEKNQTGALEVYKQKLAGIVYDDEVVEELAPIFAKLSTQEGFDKVFALLEAKEQQIEKIAGGEWTTDSEEDVVLDPMQSDKPTQTKTLSAEEILAQKYK